MRRRRQSSRRGAAAIGLQLGGISIACAALLAGYAPAHAQALDPVPKEKPKAEPEVGPQPDPNARPRTRTRRRPKTRTDRSPARLSEDGLKVLGGFNSRAVGRSTGSKRQRPVNTAFQANPNAKWVCDKQTMVRESIWRGRSTLTYEFFIRNEGTADLRIKASGG